MNQTRLRIVVALVATLLVAGVFPLGDAARAAPTTDRFLSLTPLPSKLPTSSGGTSSFPALVVSIKDPSGNTIIPSNDTVVYLASSESAVIAVQPTVTIKAGYQYAVATVTTSQTPGNSTVTAVSPGFEAASTVFDASAPRGYPTQLLVYPLPATYPSGQAVSSTYTVLVVDAAGLPARSIGPTIVQATSSDTAIVSAKNAQINDKGTVGYGSLSIAGPAGSATITVSASGLVSAEAPITVGPSGGKASVLKLGGPAVLPADGQSYSALTIALQDNQSQDAPATTSVQVLLTSSRPDVVSVPPTVSMKAGQSFATVTIQTSAASGTTYITASAPNFASSTVVLSTVSIPPTQLGIYLATDSATYSPIANTLSIVVQLQDSQGVPAEARAAATVIVSFSNSTLKSPLMLNITKGADLTYAEIPLVAATEGTFTAVSNGLAAASAKFSAAPLAVYSNLGASQPSILTDQSDTLTYTIEAQGRPLGGANLTWTTTSGSISGSSPWTSASGTGSATFVPSSAGSAVVTVTAYDPVTGNVNATANIFVAAVVPPASPSLLSTIFSYIYYIAAGAVAAVVAVVFFLRRRRGGGKVEEDDAFSTDEAEPGAL